VKSFLDFINYKVEWPDTQRYIDSSEELIAQIDVTYIVRKLMYIDAVIAQLMERHEIDAMYLRQKPTLEQAKEQRIKHFANELLKKMRKTQNHIFPEEMLSGKDNIMDDYLRESPSHLHAKREQPQPQPKPKRECEDVSALAFS
jgi:uncharacterized membrane-anchored protein YhcB (DUF1043 family)